MTYRTSVEGFYIAVRSGVEDHHEPKVFLSSRVSQFFKEVLKITPEHLALQLESWIIADLGQSVYLLLYDTAITHLLYRATRKDVVYRGEEIQPRGYLRWIL